MEEGHRKTKLRQEVLPVTYGQITTRYKSPFEGSPEEHCGQVLPVVKRPFNDSPPFKGTVGGTETDTCWWCNGGRQSREHLFKECLTWKREIGELWTAVGEASGMGEQTDEPFKNKKGLG